MRGLWALAALCWVAPATAQVAPNRSAQYLFAAGVTDARALWVNPAGLALTGDISVTLDLTVGDPGSRGQLRQISGGFNSRGLAFAYQRDRFSSDLTGHTYRVGLAGRGGRLALGVTAAFYRGGDGGTGWDVGALYAAGPHLTVGGVLANLGQPTVRGLQLRNQLVPGLALHSRRKGLALEGQGAVTVDSVLGYAVGLRATLPFQAPVQLVARVDLDRTARRTGFAFAVSVGRWDRLGLVATTPGDASDLNAVSLYGLSARRGSESSRSRVARARPSS